MQMYLSDYKSCSKKKLNPQFFCVGVQMVMVFLQASCAGNKQISGKTNVYAKQVINP